MRKVLLTLLVATLPAISAMADSPADEQMAHRIGVQLKQSGQLRNYEIGVKYHDGVASLDGRVASPEQRSTAIRLAQKVKGVSRVECKLAITNGSRTSRNQEENLQLASATESNATEGTQKGSAAPLQNYQHREPAAMPNQQQVQQLRMANSGRMGGIRPQQRNNMPLPSRQMPSMMPVRQASAMGVNQASCQSCDNGGMMGPGGGMGGDAPMGFVPGGGGSGPNYENPSMPGYAWPSYASYPNYAALSYPQQYSPTAWPYIGPFYPYPQVPLAWRKVSLEWDDGWWFLDFSSHNSSH